MRSRQGKFKITTWEKMKRNMFAYYLPPNHIQIKNKKKFAFRQLHREVEIETTFWWDYKKNYEEKEILEEDSEEIFLDIHYNHKMIWICIQNMMNPQKKMI